jgi:hypothetical protein
MITWHGDPLGVDCLDPGDAAEGGVREEVKGLSMDANGLSLDIAFGLEDKHTDYRPPPLRYGWPYHVGLRPVYLGGVILPIESAVARYEKNFVSGSAFPNRSEYQGRRFLRHERIEAPALTVPEAMAKGLPKEIEDQRQRSGCDQQWRKLYPEDLGGRTAQSKRTERDRAHPVSADHAA